MTTLHAIILGLVQGITEFLPVSSSGHLILIPAIFGWEDQGISFDVMVHMGTLFAVCIYFYKDIWELILAFFGKGTQVTAKRNLIRAIIIGTIPAVIIGLLFKDVIEENLRSTAVVGVGLIFWGIILWFADKKELENKHQIEAEKLGWKQSFFVGCAQAIALIPGTSRSGITITAGLFSGLSKVQAIRYSFLLSIPVIGGAGILAAKDIVESGADQSVSILITGMISAFIGGIFAIMTILKIVQKWRFLPFVWYRIILGVGLIVFWLIQ